MRTKVEKRTARTYRTYRTSCTFGGRKLAQRKDFLFADKQPYSKDFFDDRNCRAAAIQEIKMLRIFNAVAAIAEAVAAGVGADILSHAATVCLPHLHERLEMAADTVWPLAIFPSQNHAAHNRAQ